MTVQSQVLSAGKILGEHILFYFAYNSPPKPEAFVSLLMAPTYHNKAFAYGWLSGNTKIILMKAKVNSLTFKIVLQSILLHGKKRYCFCGPVVGPDFP